MISFRSLGQHVLTSERHLHATVEAGELTADDAVLEIGPGTGALTRILLQSPSKHVVAVEKGDVFYRRLVEEFADVRMSEGKEVLCFCDALW